MIRLCNRIIEYSFYAIFLIIPWALWKNTSELFEFNKMWLTFGLTIIIGASWFSKMLLQKRIFVQRTPLDIPIVLFLLSQVLSTIFSQDPHVSVWGYYSRWNGGLLSIISYVFLYYAFVSNLFSKTIVYRLLAISLTSGLIVALWGLPSHFGYDPTCLLFRGTFDVSCWTADFMPTVRIFSTLGQPNWLAAYLAILIPITMAFGFQKTQNNQNVRKSEALTVRRTDVLAHRVFRAFWNKQTFSILLILLFYVDLLYTRAQSGFLGIWFAVIFFALAYFWVERKKLKIFSFEALKSPISIFILGFLLITFVIGTPIAQINGITWKGISKQFQKIRDSKTTSVSTPTPILAQFFKSGGTESGDIRLLVWQGAVNAWKSNFLFGTGVETFAFAYYKYKPAEHNLTSEWNFLYNKAHNEYLNFLATTGIVGLGSYLFMIGTFLFISTKKLLFSENSEHSENQKFRQSDNLNVRKSGTPSFPSSLNIALIASYLSILVTNFFGFSVVITNIYLFMIPAFVFALTAGTEPGIKNHESGNAKISLYHWTGIFFAFATCFWLIVNLFRFWQADIAYALGYNLDRAGEYQQAYPSLHKAVELRRDELVFKDELSINNAIIAAGLLTQQPIDDQKQQAISVASTLEQEAINISNEILTKSPNNAVFWKTRVRLFYTLSQVDSRYLPRALTAIEKASLLAPADANIFYNLGVLYGQSNNIKKGIQALEKTIQLKPDYRDAHYALGLFYHQASLDEKAIDQMQYILDHLNPNDAGALESIKSWKQ